MPVRRKARKTQCTITPLQSLARRSDSEAIAASSACTEDGGRALDSVLAILRRPTSGIGFAGICSEVYRKVHNTFHVDQHR